MATHTVTIANSGIDTDAKMRTAIQQFEAAIIACGFVHDPVDYATTPSQLDPATAIKPSTAYTQIGYRFYRFNDALQATAPLYLMVAYQTGYLATCPAFYVAVGNFNIVDGVLIKVKSSSGWCVHAPCEPYSSGGACRFSGDGSRLQMHLWKDYGNASTYGSLERTKTSDGQDTGDGIMFTWGRVGPTKRTGSWRRDGLFALDTDTFGFMNRISATTLVVNGDKYVLPIRTYGPHPLPPMMGMYNYIEADFTKGTPVQILCMDGQYHTYLPLGNDHPIYNADPLSPFGGTIYRMIRWE